MKSFGKKGAWAYTGTAQSFRVPTIISGTGKATKFKFCMHIYRPNRNKSLLKFREKQPWPWAQSGTPENFQGTHRPYIRRIAWSSLRQLSFLVTINLPHVKNLMVICFLAPARPISNRQKTIMPNHADSCFFSSSPPYYYTVLVKNGVGRNLNIGRLTSEVPQAPRSRCRMRRGGEGVSPSPADWGSVVSSPSGLRGRAPAENGF